MYKYLGTISKNFILNFSLQEPNATGLITIQVSDNILHLFDKRTIYTDDTQQDEVRSFDICFVNIGTAIYLLMGT